MKGNIKPTKAQIDVLRSDWLTGTRNADYIHKNTKGTISNSVAEGASLSEFITNGKIIDEELLRDAREAAQNVVDTVTKEPVKVIMGMPEVSFTNGEIINVATDYFDDPSLSPGQKLDLLIGFSVHEACHINHTDMKRTEILMDEEERKNPLVARLKMNLMNIIEDERIEHILGEAPENGGDGMPGLTDYIAVCKKHIFGKYIEEEKTMGEHNECIPRFLNALTLAVRYPSSLTEKMAEDNYEPLSKARKVLTPFPKSQTGVEQAADSIIEIMKDMIKEEQEQQKREKEQGTEKGQGQQNQSGQSGQSGQQKQSGQQGQSPSDNKTQNKGITKKELEQAFNAALNSEQAQKELKNIEKALDASTRKGSKDSRAINGKQSCSYINGDSEKDSGEGAGGRNSVTYIAKRKGDENKYNAAYNKVRPYVPAMAKALRCKMDEKEYSLRGQKNGKLDTNKLISYSIGSENIFRKKSTITTETACICILIDESGSMSKQRMTAAREAAVLINEAVKSIKNLELFVYGFTNNELNIYAERKMVDRYALGSTKSDGGTPTAEAMRVSAKRIRKMTSSKCLMLVITDGCPNDRAATILQDQTLGKKGFIPVGVDIVGGNAVKDIFKRSISICDLKLLASEVGRIVKKELAGALNKYAS